MQELVNKLIAEVGLSSEQATQTVSTVMAFVKSKLPPAFSGNLEALLGGEKMEMKQETLQEKAEDLANATKDKLEDLADQAKEKLSIAADKAEDIAKDAFGKLKDFLNRNEEEKK